MSEIEKIEGRRVVGFFKALRQDGTPLKVFLSDKGFEREQRRRQFRISVPAGAEIFFNLNNRRYELKLIDISLGGSLGVLEDVPGKTRQDQDPLRVRHLQNVELIREFLRKRLRINV